MNATTAKKPHHKKQEPISVADFITKAIELSGRSQIEIAEIAGFPKANVISMIKAGKIALPQARIAGMARALNVDPLHLYKLVMAQEFPDTWASIETEITRQPILSTGERELIETLREAGLSDYRVATDEQKEKVVKLMEPYVSKQQAAE
ncbi:helix-turn-helix domain-containing protein [Cupriavidus campinensis]|uniref:Helix-turn-helix transcriptional regulator n=1 Tax=Cupriavidus campinensis TaxID=151783 RepID=A0ABY3ESN8_9BURK|nr:helix-turn-helix transcriptional regulator [Cupriavidus campinensis]TSP13989.1 helix-turn-helix transcriptional regulator [Cupriavidus campinensis]